MKHNKRRGTNVVALEEAFIEPERYKELAGLEGVPDLAAFPNGMFILGTKGFKRVFGYYAESQIDKAKSRQILGN